MKIGNFSASCKIALLAAGVVLTFAVTPAIAEEKATPVVDIIPAHSTTGEAKEVPFNDDEATHPALRLTPDKSEIVALDRDAASIIVGNPIHANVVADSVRKLVVIPRTPGATYFTVLDRDGNVIMQRHVIVASPKEDYVRVKRVCNSESGKGCQDTSVFYCPDMCHEIGSQAEEDSSSGSSSDTQDSSADNAGAENSEGEKAETTQ